MRFNSNQAREIIMSHYTKPEFKTKLDPEQEPTFFSTTCQDKLILKTSYIDNKLSSAEFDGHGCAVFLAATDLFIKQALGKTKEEIQVLIEDFTRFVMQEPISEEQINSLGDLWVFFNVKVHLNRTTCALLTAKNFLDAYKNK
ncbi:iron-sulfur cluster scaffold-like protein [Mycoplasmopsis sturni]|uniref:iron-sulfur cluster scaffold-like protein n=1 Tax=Mycoplasmopsis sturni TaxID=39047 RepID=UPI00056BE381|nr:iron-sulfur cluster scaffold-like protein [Mycoplasmopsis sturni]